MKNLDLAYFFHTCIFCRPYPSSRWTLNILSSKASMNLARPCKKKSKIQSRTLSSCPDPSLVDPNYVS